jgi:hypothetical protein
VVAVALEHRKLNANNLASLSAARGLRHGFISLGYAQTSAEAALIRLKDKSADFLIIVDGVVPGDPPDFLNRASEGMAQMVDNGRLRAVPLEDVGLAPGISARLYSIRP